MTAAFIITACLLAISIVALLVDARKVRAQRDEAVAKLDITEAWIRGNLKLLRFELAIVSPEVWEIAAALDRAFEKRAAIDFVELKNALFRAQQRHDADLLKAASQLIRTANQHTGARA